MTADINSLKIDVADMTDEQLLEMQLSIRKDRRNANRKPAKAVVKKVQADVNKIDSFLAGLEGEQ